jgi:hypothetical protein
VVAVAAAVRLLSAAAKADDAAAAAGGLVLVVMVAAVRADVLSTADVAALLPIRGIVDISAACERAC